MISSTALPFWNVRWRRKDILVSVYAKRKPNQDIAHYNSTARIGKERKIAACDGQKAKILTNIQPYIDK